MLGKHFLIGLRPTVDLHPEDRRLLATLRPSGVVVFRPNFATELGYEAWHARFVRLLTDVKETIGRDRILICIDHEGGTVLRPPAPITPFGFARQWASSAGPVGRAMGQELASLGINVNFAPVVDIDSNPLNPVIGPRAFSHEASGVIGAALPFIAEQEKEGVLACPKHFPGHGDTAVDSHVGLPTVAASEAELAKNELLPFAAVASAARMIMTAHISYPAIDATAPATMSRVIVTGILRQRLGYRGVVATDDLGMGAISKLLEAPGASANILRSGTDLLTLCSYFTRTERALDMVAEWERSLADGSLAEDVLAESGARIDRLLAGVEMPRPQLLDSGLFALHGSLAPLRARPGVAGEIASLKES